MVTITLESRIVDAIVRDMNSRKFGYYWLGNMDKEIRDEVLEAWREIVRQEMAREAT